MRRLHFLLMACALAAGGCVLPCGGGACNAKGRLWEPPAQRYEQTEFSVTDSCAVCPTPYPTFSKYWPGLDEWSTNHTAKNVANRQLFSQQLRTFRLLSSHFKDGYRQAFIDIANGGSGDCPPVPPPKYWNTYYRSECGEKYAEQWFNGYRAGAAAANVQIGKMRTVHSSADWQVPPRNKFAGADQCVSGGCSTGQCDPRIGTPPPSNFVCRPGMGMMGDSPQVPVGYGHLLAMPQIPQTQFSPSPGFDPQMQSMPQPMTPQPMLGPQQPQPNFGMAPGYGTIPTPSFGPSAPAMAPQPQQPVMGPGYSAPAPVPNGTSRSFDIGPGYSGSSTGSAPFGAAPQFGPSQSGPAPGHSSGGSSAWTNPPPSRLPPEGLVF